VFELVPFLATALTHRGGVKPAPVVSLDHHLTPRPVQALLEERGQVSVELHRHLPVVYIKTVTETQPMIQKIIRRKYD